MKTYWNVPWESEPVSNHYVPIKIEEALFLILEELKGLRADMAELSGWSDRDGDETYTDEERKRNKEDWDRLSGSKVEGHTEDDSNNPYKWDWSQGSWDWNPKSTKSLK